MGVLVIIACLLAQQRRQQQQQQQQLHLAHLPPASIRDDIARAVMAVTAACGAQLAGGMSCDV